MTAISHCSLGTWYWMTTASTQSSSSRYEKSRRDPLHTWHGWRRICILLVAKRMSLTTSAPGSLDDFFENYAQEDDNLWIMSIVSRLGKSGPSIGFFLIFVGFLARLLGLHDCVGFVLSPCPFRQCRQFTSKGW